MSIRMLSNSTLLKGGMYSLFSFFNQGIGFLLLIILAKYILPDEYGQLSLFNTVVMFLGYIIALSTEGYISISYFKSTEKEFGRDVGAIFVLATIIFFILLLLVFAFGGLLTHYLYMSPLVIYLAIIISYFQIFVVINLNYHRVREKIITYGVLSCNSALFNFFLSLLFVIVFHLSWLGRVYANAISSVVFGLIGIGILLKHRVLIFSYGKDRLSKLMYWGVPLIPHLATSWLRQGCDRYIINYFYSFSEVGLFSFALNLANIMEVVGSAFNSTNSVEIFKVLSDKGKTAIEKKSILLSINRRIIGIYLVVLIILLIGGLFFVPIFLSSYSASIPYFMILVLYGFLRSIYFIYCNYLFYWDKTKNLMYITCLTSILHLFFSLIFTRYSLYFTAAIYCVSQLVIVALVYIYAHKLIEKQLENYDKI